LQKGVKAIKKRFFPNIFTNTRLLGLKGKAWIPAARGGAQSLVPKDPLLSKKLGLAKKEKILVIAGYYGDWARALSESCEVRYTDLGKEMAAFAGRKKAKVRSFTARPAELLVRKPMLYDWSFLFEPYPLVAGSLCLVLARSLLNKKGCKILERSNLDPTFYAQVTKVARLYNAKSKFEQIRLTGLVNKSKIECPVAMFTLSTNNEARKKAMLDMGLLRELNLAAKNRKQLQSGQLCKKLGISQGELEESSQRLHAITPAQGAEFQGDYIQ